jgi:hypothetical protein
MLQRHYFAAKELANPSTGVVKNDVICESRTSHELVQMLAKCFRSSFEFKGPLRARAITNRLSLQRMQSALHLRPLRIDRYENVALYSRYCLHILRHAMQLNVRGAVPDPFVSINHAKSFNNAPWNISFLMPAFWT